MQSGVLGRRCLAMTRPPKDQVTLRVGGRLRRASLCSPATPVHICLSLFADPLCPQKEPPTYMCALLRKSQSPDFAIPDFERVARRTGPNLASCLHAFYWSRIIEMYRQCYIGSILSISAARFCPSAMGLDSWRKDTFWISSWLLRQVLPSPLSMNAADRAEAAMPPSRTRLRVS